MMGFDNKEKELLERLAESSRIIDEWVRLRAALELQLADLRRLKITETPADTRTLLKG